METPNPPANPDQTPDSTAIHHDPEAPGRPILYTSRLTLGQEVSISWTSCGRDFQAFGPVCKINRKSIRVALPRTIEGCYPAGFEVHVPIPGTSLNGAWYR